MQFENSFEVPLPPDEAWNVLLDVPRIAPCFPGAELTETLPDNRFKGRAGVKVGPVNLFFAGEAQIVDRDDDARTARVKARGNDTKGRGQASATVDFALVPAGSGSRVNVSTDLNMTGAVAQYGRASGLMKEIAGALIDEFAQNLAREIQGSNAATASGAASAADGTAGGTSAVGGTSDGAATRPASVSHAPPAAKPISAFSLLWKAFTAWISGLLGLRKDKAGS
ncbi:MAG: hypothetical protein RLZ98_1450 [Pseudomonadota bacterium]|jgi:carbon monoxide dehydrogenase subunit G